MTNAAKTRLKHLERCPELRTEAFAAERRGKPLRGADGGYLGDAPGETITITRCLDCGAQIDEPRS